ncbi:MAG: DUF6603 domain-containing protein, partial [Bacteroidota bacterium]
GGLYLALTPQAIMLGGFLNYAYKKGKVDAYLDLELNVLITWKPFHYFFQFSITVGASYTIKIFKWTKKVSVHIGMSGQMWGPPFGGQGKLDLYIWTITINFGKDTGKKPPPISYEEFKASFLPQKADQSAATRKQLRANPNANYAVVKAEITKGLLKSANTDDTTLDYYRLKPGDMELTLSTAIPMKTVSFNGTSPDLTGMNTDIAVGPMKLSIEDFGSDFTVTLNNINEKGDPPMSVAVVTAKAPRALWDDSEPNNKGDTLVDNVGTQLIVTPYKREQETTAKMPVKTLLLQIIDFTGTISWSSASEAHSDSLPTDPWSTVEATIDSAADARKSMIDGLNQIGYSFSDTTTISKSYGESLIDGPMYRVLGEEKTT